MALRGAQSQQRAVGFGDTMQMQSVAPKLEDFDRLKKGRTQGTPGHRGIPVGELTAQWNLLVGPDLGDLDDEFLEYVGSKISPLAEDTI